MHPAALHIYTDNVLHQSFNLEFQAYSSIIPNILPPDHQYQTLPPDYQYQTLPQDHQYQTLSSFFTFFLFISFYLLSLFWQFFPLALHGKLVWPTVYCGPRNFELWNLPFAAELSHFHGITWNLIIERWLMSQSCSYFWSSPAGWLVQVTCNIRSEDLSPPRGRRGRSDDAVTPFSTQLSRGICQNGPWNFTKFPAETVGHITYTMM